MLRRRQSGDASPHSKAPPAHKRPNLRGRPPQPAILIATGHANEKQDATFINQTSYIENCETSAVGRALAMLGIGIESAIASADEVANAQANQKQGGEGKPTEGQPQATLDTVLARKEKIKGLMSLVAQLTPDQRDQFKAKYPEGTKKLRESGLNRLEQELKEAIAQQLPKAA